jgi:hypothetical protein
MSAPDTLTRPSSPYNPRVPERPAKVRITLTERRPLADLSGKGPDHTTWRWEVHIRPRCGKRYELVERGGTDRSMQGFGCRGQECCTLGECERESCKRRA